ncbi:4'-phosphopantetheinyl transferase superfamily protein [Brevibacterium casei]|uniref:4'-phosphopantetheinyl transferase superfamily protein n=1 Tax=Brevibacterium casei TaxID=33889 RepID=UPI0021AE409B|nr:4'-phosphopantetheinyl transferase superfamily protein [Brevibacterium casei]MCT1446132.1 4'-phosphopantetheinyl transferase superfamily protein [Brevibacterium casei]
MHTSRFDGENAKMCHRSPSPLRLWTASWHSGDDVAALLVERALGTEARRYFRSSDRCFPLCYEDKYFSVSHSALTAAVVVADVPVGVDIEQRLSSPGCADLACAWSPGERAELQGEVAVERVSTEIWTAKEAAGKALGVGLQAMPSAIESSPVLTAAAHRTIVMPSAVGELVHLDSHGMWHGESHLRIAWRQDS